MLDAECGSEFSQISSQLLHSHSILRELEIEVHDPRLYLISCCIRTISITFQPIPLFLPRLQGWPLQPPPPQPPPPPQWLHRARCGFSICTTLTFEEFSGLLYLGLLNTRARDSSGRGFIWRETLQRACAFKVYYVGSESSAQYMPACIDY